MNKNYKIISGIMFEDCGEMLITGDENGGIIDRNPILDKWFVVFNDDRAPLEDWFDTREDAIAAFEESQRMRALLDAFVL